MVPGFGVSAECQSIGTSGKKVEGLLFSPKNSQLFHILSFCSYGAVSLFILPTGSTALDSEPRGRRYVKNMGQTGTVFIQGPSILLLVWRSIMFNGSFLRVCRILQFVKKTRCLDRVPKHRNQWPLNKDGSCCLSYC